MGPTESQVLAVLKRNVVHRELGINVVDLGLVCNVCSGDGSISVDMTLTSPTSPLAGELPALVEQALREHFPSFDVEVSLVWDPPWSPERMSDDARRRLAQLS